jgi:hypothetical protein
LEVIAMIGCRRQPPGRDCRHFQKADANLHRLLSFAGHCATAYRQATGRLCRQFNLAFFERLYIDDDYGATSELAKPFDTILGEGLRRTATAQADEDLRAALEAAIEAALEAAIEAALEAAIEAALEAAIEAALEAAIEAALEQRRAQTTEVTNEQRPPRPERVLVGAQATPAASEVVGWSQNNMVELVGLEPTTFWLPARRSPS